MRTHKFLDLIMAIFITVLIVSNIASSAKIVDWGESILGIPLAFDAGTLLFPASYIFGDILTEVYGYKASRRVIWAGFFCLALSAGVFALVAAMPGEAQWQQYAGEAAYLAILGGMASGGIAIASLAGYWTGEFTNSFILAKLKIVTGGRWLWMRTIGSTIAGELVDTLVFVLIAAFFGIFPWGIFLTLVVTNYLFKVGVEVLLTPLTYVVVRALKKAEGVDHFDRDTNFNPFQKG